MNASREWQLQDAKARFSELVKLAVADGPQVITVHGEPTAVLLSSAEFAKLTWRSLSLVDFFQKSPLKGLALDLKRDRSPNRENPVL
jgi:antitoxin Phd